MSRRIWHLICRVLFLCTLADCVIAQEFFESMRLPPIDWQSTAAEPLGAEDASAEDDIPRIPEPMVFDLVRPLGAKRGEFEINTLALIPIGRAPNSDLPDALGLSGRKFEWAPEVEYAVRDGFAVEFELPFETTTLEAYKSALQWTFGTGFNQRYIHGAQLIVEYVRHPDSWMPTLLYLGGARFDETWSALAMIGVRADTGAEEHGDRIQQIFNLSIFADVTDHVTLGVESNFEQSLRGNSALMLMPQLHWEIGDYFMIQSGVGGRFASDGSMGEAGMRVIRSY